MVSVATVLIQQATVGSFAATEGAIAATVGAVVAVLLFLGGGFRWNQARKLRGHLSDFLEAGNDLRRRIVADQSGSDAAARDVLLWEGGVIEYLRSRKRLRHLATRFQTHGGPPGRTYPLKTGEEIRMYLDTLLTTLAGFLD